MDAGQLRKKTVRELAEIAKTLGITSVTKYRKEELVDIILNGGQSPLLMTTYEDDSDELMDDMLDEQNEESQEGKSVHFEIETDMPEHYIPEVYEAVDDKGTDLPEKPTYKPHHSQNTEEQLGDEIEGILEILPEKGFGFIRFKNESDIYVSPKQVTRFGLKHLDKVYGVLAKPEQGDKNRRLRYVNEVNGMRARDGYRRPNFDDLTPTYPTERLVLEKAFDDVSLRLIDLFAPIGKGQRGLLVAPPKAGKTMLLQKIAKAINANYPEVDVIVLLIDERPEEVTEMKKSINAEVFYSTFDEPPVNHIKMAEYALQRAKNMVEMKKDVVILLDSITRLARAYNLVMPSSGRTLSGGFDPAALHKPKRFFGAARNVEEGGSLTILATALIETGSKMDEVIFEEFKGTGNMELTLSRKLAEKRIFPAVDIRKSGTRKEEMLLSADELEAVWKIRKSFAPNEDSTDVILDHLKNTADNIEFIDFVRKLV